MLLAVRRCIAAFYIEGCVRRASVMRATPAAHVHHVVVRMLLAVRGCLALHIQQRALRARVMQATLAAHVYHVDGSMLLAVYRYLATLHVEGRVLRAGEV